MDFNDLSGELSRIGAKLDRELEDKLVGDVVARVRRDAEAASPVAEGPVRTKGGGTRPPGLLKKSWRIVPGSKTELEGDTAAVVNVAPHAIVIDRGRRQGRHSRKTGGTRTQGSPQAPRGISKPVVEKLEAAMPKLLDKAIGRILK